VSFHIQEKYSKDLVPGREEPTGKAKERIGDDGCKDPRSQGATKNQLRWTRTRGP
jgi:hypothetical protein